MKRVNRLGIFGGTFNPIHMGHTLIAQSAREKIGLQKVIFIPSARPPHKTEFLEYTHRFEMTRLAVKGEHGFEVSDIEARLDGLSYTVNTLERFKSDFGISELYLIIGADSLLDFPRWHRPDRIVEIAKLLVYPRPGVDIQKAEKRFLDHATILDYPVLDISASWLRDQVRQEKSIRHWVSMEVEDYIRTNKIYQKEL